MQIIRIPSERIKYIREHKNRLERELGLKINIRDNAVELFSEDGYTEYLSIDIIKALGLGFDLDDVLKLKDPEYVLVIVDLDEILPNEKTITRQLGRVIGTRGIAKRTFENEGNVKIRIVDHSIGILGLRHDVEVIKRAILKLVSGSKHSTVMRYITDHIHDESI